MKTAWEFNHLNVDLCEYLREPCEIDEELYLYIAETTPQHYVRDDLCQDGEAVFSINGVLFFITLSKMDGKYFYLGILPEFKQ